MFPGQHQADNILKNLHLTTNDYNNGTTIQVLAFLRKPRAVSTHFNSN